MAPGTYTGEGNRDLDTWAKRIVLKSVSGPDSTVIDCQGSYAEPHRGFLFHSGEDSTAVLDGFTVQGGYGPFDIAGAGYLSSGGGLACIDSSSPTISRCMFVGNYAEAHGGGLFLSGSSPIVRDCTLDRDSAFHGGGIYTVFSSSLIQSCLFVSCRAEGRSGGFYCSSSSPSIQGSSFHLDSSSGGGAIFASQGAPNIEGCLFNGNYSSDDGGALLVLSCSSDSRISNCSIVGNMASSYAGGVDLNDWEGTLEHCLIYSNQALNFSGGGVLVYEGSGYISYCTIVANEANQGAGLHCYSFSGTIDNCIIAFNGSGEAVFGTAPTLSCCDIYGNTGGDWVGYIANQYGVNGNFSEDPLFCDTTSGNHNISINLPCHPDSSCGLVGSNDFGCLGEMVTDFWIEDEISLLNVINDTPTFVWDCWDSLSQVAFEIAVGTDDNWDYAEMWNPAAFETSDTFVTYAAVAPVR